MQAMRRFVQAQFYTIVMLMLAGGFALLLVELLLTEHTDGIQLVGVGASVTGLLLILAALFVRERAAIIVAVMLVMLSVTGVIGVVEHLEAAEERAGEAQRMDAASVQQVAYVADDGDNDSDRPAGGGGEAEAAPPPLAPLSLAGLSILGAVAILGAPRKQLSL